MLTAVTAFGADVGLAPIPRETAWAPDMRIWAIAKTPTTIYIGGDFEHVGPTTGAGVPIDATTGSPVASYPRVENAVRTCVADGSGGWYIGGIFARVGGMERKNLAHILSNGSVDPSWKPNADSSVLTIAIHGSTVYVGGFFARIDGQIRRGIAALDAATGAVLPWDPAPKAWDDFGPRSLSEAIGNAFSLQGPVLSDRRDHDPVVFALAVSDDGGTVYVGGDIKRIGGQARDGTAALDAATAAATPWNPKLEGVRLGSSPRQDCFIHAFAVSGSTIYVGGHFKKIGGQPRNGIGALDANGSGAVLAWNPNPSTFLPGGLGGIRAIAVSRTTVYVGGCFTDIGGQRRINLAALDAATGLATAWDPSVTGGYAILSIPSVQALAVSGSTVYVGGTFTSIGAQTRHNLAAVDATTGVANDWDPNVGGPVEAIAVSRSAIYAGGSFRGVGGVWRNGLAALDAATGRATAWDPSPNVSFRRIV
ncbi:MAG: hypothetical protein NTW86_12290 [Candidatus Sumerlaeota bacterium]|nr:hypothetical protein [Candidatus Sumerlaeota bacterium]